MTFLMAAISNIIKLIIISIPIVIIMRTNERTEQQPKWAASDGWVWLLWSMEATKDMDEDMDSMAGWLAGWLAGTAIT
ncbi:hypothetical protein AWZ03_007338 [Drosophila navojoa]|uniref:Uncharacterized protein n=1 Tax=Drosophila navojoa TaxID=7232 RepID=A0A484BD82_DRONA|nr:hypothetical protein AWZ03_007338 [Drosophila navojoa]